MITETVMDIWENESVEESLFKAIYGLSEEKYWNPQSGGIVGFRDIFMSKAVGCYFPPIGRAFYTKTIDVKNDGLPGVCHLSGFDNFFYYGQTEDIPTVASCTIFPIKSAPERVRVPKGHALYKIIFWKFYENGAPPTFNYELNPCDEGMNTIIWNDYVAVNINSDSVIPCFHKNSTRSLNRDFVRFLFCTTVSSEADRRFLWNVSLHYPFADKMRIWLDFGVHEEHVKSLLFARDTPLTETGRKRPIQHWVSSHKRRIKNKIEINVEKYLRGVTEFQMHGYDFIISSPRKFNNHNLLQDKAELIKIGITAPQYTDSSAGKENRDTTKKAKREMRRWRAKINRALAFQPGDEIDNKRMRSSAGPH